MIDTATVQPCSYVVYLHCACVLTAAAAGGVGPDGSQQSRLVSSTSTPGQSDELHTTQGWLYKRGKGVRSWKLRWFELGVIKNKVSKYHACPLKPQHVDP